MRRPSAWRHGIPRRSLNPFQASAYDDSLLWGDGQEGVYPEFWSSVDRLEEVPHPSLPRLRAPHKRRCRAAGSFSSPWADGAVCGLPSETELGFCLVAILARRGVPIVPLHSSKQIACRAGIQPV